MRNFISRLLLERKTRACDSLLRRSYRRRDDRDILATKFAVAKASSRNVLVVVNRYSPSRYRLSSKRENPGVT